MGGSLETTVRRFGWALLGTIGATACSDATTSASSGRPGDEKSRDSKSSERGPSGKPSGKLSGKLGYEKLSDGSIVRHGSANCDPAITAPACIGTEDTKSCRTDADCKSGANGKCITDKTAPIASTSGGTFCGCVYSCATDSDCDNDSVCVCGDITTGRSHCVRAECRSDQDCDEGDCGYSRYFNGCGDEEFLRCRSPSDKCHSDADCANGTTCALSIDERKTKPSWDCRGIRCTVGRPLVVDGNGRFAPPIERAGWSAPVAGSLGCDLAPKLRAVAAEHYLQIAALEHASVASFARFSLGLLALGAPPELLLAAGQAALDEVNHAQICYGLAEAYGAPRCGPAELPEALADLHVDVASFTRALVLEGCFAETLSALEAEHAAGAAGDAKLRAALAGIAADELRHAALAFRTLRWLTQKFPAMREIARCALADARASIACEAAQPGAVDLIAHGVLDEPGRWQLRRAAFDSVVAAPLASMLA